MTPQELRRVVLMYQDCAIAAYKIGRADGLKRMPENLAPFTMDRAKEALIARELNKPKKKR